ncbi:MAG TPA: hypothetical protein VHE80_04250 [Acidimicrobiales bacterium]|nr:hypothetical protein [Acidimicrobiales bacterium]
MPRIVDTTPTFDEFARDAFLESPITREQQWKERYEGAYPEVFEAFYARQPEQKGRAALARELSRVRDRAQQAGPLMAGIIEEVEPSVREALGVTDVAEPVHVLMIGPYSANAVVGRLGDDVALFHCLEWFQSPDAAKVLVAHEDTHAWHEAVLGQPGPEDDVAWTTFYEGLGVQASRTVVPDRPEDDYFWYGLAGFEDWLPWCREHRDDLVNQLRTSLDDPGAVDTLYGAGMVEGRWRVGFFLADLVVGGMGRTLPELVRMSVPEAQEAVRTALAPS